VHVNSVSVKLQCCEPIVCVNPTSSADPTNIGNNRNPKTSATVDPERWCSLRIKELKE